jgi:hypothetical protein
MEVSIDRIGAGVGSDQFKQALMMRTVPDSLESGAIERVRPKRPEIHLEIRKFDE